MKYLDGRELTGLHPTPIERSMSSWNPGLAWNDGKLYRFGKSDIVVMRLWPEMLAWRRTKTKPWSSTRRYADQFFCDYLTSSEQNQFKSDFIGPYEDWRQKGQTWDRRNAEFIYTPALATIPKREEALAFKFLERRWHALALMARCPGSTDLFESNPGLAFALASNWVFHRPMVQQPMRSARALITKKQSALQEWLGFPGTERVRKILAKIDPASLRIRDLARFQRVIQSPLVQEKLAHLPRLTGELLRFACDRDAL